MNAPPTLPRRQFLRGAAAATLSATGALSMPEPGRAAVPVPSFEEKKKVGAVVTIYRRNSHADVILTKILEGWRHDGGAGPNLQLAALYVDQFPKGDMARELAKKHGFTIVDRIEDAVTLGTNRLAVDGVISIGEHGDYPYNDLGQHLYPRKRFLDGILRGFAACGEVTPVFSDKHLGPQWEDAQAMYRAARTAEVPFMAGSSIPVSFRKPDLDLPVDTPLDAAVGIGYGGFESYGFHTLEFFQTLVEKRSRRETGVRQLQCLTGAEMLKAIDRGVVDAEVFAAALAATPHRQGVQLSDLDPQRTGLFVLDYVDGFRGTVLMLQGLSTGFGAAVRRADGTVQACEAEGRSEPRYPHFAFLLHAIEKMIHSGKPSYPVERTLLVSGVLDRALRSRQAGGQQIRTPELSIEYRCRDYPYAEKITLPGEAAPWK